MQQKSDFLYLHIPKTGGTTLIGLLGQCIKKEQFYYLSTHVEDWGHRVEYLLNSPPGIVVCGHPVQFSELWNVIVEKRSGARFGTTLRNPVHRVLSNYYFYLNTGNTGPRYEIRRGRLTVRQAIEHRLGDLVDNLQTKIVAAFGRPFDRLEPCNDGILRQAKVNLAKMAWFGILERFNESVQLLQEELGIRADRFTRKRVTRHKPKYDNLPPEVLDYVAEDNRYDLELYEFASALFEQRLVSKPNLEDAADGMCEVIDESSYSPLPRQNN